MTDYKAIYIISPNEVSERVISEMLKADFKCTKLSSIGAYLKTGQTTIFTITEREKIDKVKKIIKEIKDNHRNCDFLIYSTEVIDFYKI